MALNDVVFIKGQGGLGRGLTSNDHISGLVLYTGSLPSGFTSGDRIKQVFSVEEAEDLGILDDYSDETKATGSYTFTAVGATNDTIEVKVAEPSGTISLGAYTRLSTDTTVTLLAASYAAAINLGTNTHGYTATPAVGVVTITARAGLGVFVNSGTPITATIVGTITGTIAQFSGGVASKQSVWHYHIAEYFRAQPQGNLYIGMYAVPGGTHDFTELPLVQAYASGTIRQFGVYIDNTTFLPAMCTAAQIQADLMYDAHRPCEIIIGADIKSIALSAITSLGGLSAENVSVSISQDGDALGFALYSAYAHSITHLGALLGSVSLAKVHESIAFVQKFNISNGTENAVIAFANGDLYNTVAESRISTLNSYRYIFARDFEDKDGTYFNDNHTAIIESSDYAYINDNRVIAKAIRLARVAYLDYLNSSIYLNSDGTLKDTTVVFFESLGDTALDQMVRDGEISAKSVVVDPAQLILTTSELSVSITLVSVGVARNIVVPIKYALSI